MKSIGIMAFCATVPIASNGFAMEVTVEGYARDMAKGQIEREIVLTWLDGVYRGLAWANAARNADKDGQVVLCAVENGGD